MTERGDLVGRLESAHLAHIDARIFAFHLVGDARYVDVTRALIGAIHQGRVRAQTSVITLYQLLAELYRRGETGHAANTARDLVIIPNLEFVPVDPDVAVQAAEVRAQLGGRPERALQVATALVERADHFLTSESTLRRIAGMSVLNLEDFA